MLIFNMKYSYSKDLKSNFKDAENNVRDVLMEVGFGVLTEINIKEAFKEKLNLEHKNYKILGACNPELAHRAINCENFVGILMPCNILLIDNQDGTTKVVFPHAGNILEITENNLMSEISIEVDNLLKSAFKNLQ